MKTIYFTCMLCIGAQAGWAQHLTWAPVGARYYYECDSSVVFEVTRDTLIQGHICSIEELVENIDSPIAITVDWSKTITYASGDTVFIFDEKDETFYELFNWNAAPGYQFTFKGVKIFGRPELRPIVTVTITDTSSVIRGARNLKTYDFEANSIDDGDSSVVGYIWYGTAIQFVGNSANRYARSGMDIYVLDRYRKVVFPPSGETIYIGDLGTVGGEIEQNCERINIRNNQKFYNNNFSVYPNPVISKLYINSILPRSKSINITVSDVYGRIVFSNALLPIDTGLYNLSLEFLSKGMYTLTIDNKSAFKFIKS